MKRLVIGLVTAFVLFVLFIVLCTYVRRPYEIVLLTRFGKLIKQDDQTRMMYNWYFKLPTDGIVRVDKRLHLYPGTLQEATTKGKEVISIQTFAAWHIVDPEKFYRAINADDDKAMGILDSKIRSLIQAKLGNHTLDELFNTDITKLHTSEIEDEVAREATIGSEDGKTQGMRDLGIEIAEVGFSRMAYAPRNAPFVYFRMIEELKRQAIDFDTRGKAAYTKIVEEGKRAAGEITAKAITEAGAIKGDADAQALAITNAFQKTPADAAFYKFWKGLEFFKTSLTRNTIYVLSTDSPFLKPLDSLNAPFPTTLPGAFVSPTDTLLPSTASSNDKK